MIYKRRTISPFKRYIVMENRLFRRILPYFAACTIMATGAVGEAEAQTRSKVFCDAFKIGCAKKTAKAKPRTVKSAKTEAARQSSKAEAARKSAKTEAARQPALKVVPKPEPKPAILQAKTPAVAAAQTSPPPEPRLEKPDLPPTGSSSYPIESVSCRAELSALGVDFSVPTDIETTANCSVVDPVQLKSIRTSTGVVALPGAPILKCAFARQFIIWLSDVAAPIVAGLAQASLASISTGPGYECRGRNGDSSAKTSEHAFGNAIDIDGITLTNKKRIEIPDVVDKQGADHRLLMAMRVAACGYFTTVLGPGSNAAHASHYHFDLGIHGKSGNYRICE